MKTLVFAALGAAFASAASAASVDQVIVRQQWPWSTDIKVEYRVSGVTQPVDLTVRAFNGDVELDAARLAKAITGDVYGIAEDGIGQFVIDPVKAFGTDKQAIANFKVRLTVADAPANRTEVIYKILDIDANPVTVTDVTRADILNGKYGTYETDYSVFSSYAPKGEGYPTIRYTSSLPDLLVWTGVTNGDLYRTSKIALRKIPSAGQSLQMGGRGDTKIACSFTKDFWIGVFPITQYQLHKYLPNFTCWMSNTTYSAHALRAADGICWPDIRGNTRNVWPKGNHSDVNDASWMKGFQTAFNNTRLDLPTEAQWEFAARAGCDQIFPHGHSNINYTYHWTYYGGLFMKTADIKLENIDRNSTDNRHGAYPPGMYAPNAYGLYDVMGNVRQLCLDRAAKEWAGRGGVDPRGSDSDESGSTYGMCRIYRGGSYYLHILDVGLAVSHVEWYKTPGNGFRICLHEED